MERMSVPMTGGTGFLGGALACALAREGVGVHALARANSGRGGLVRVPVKRHEDDVTAPPSLGSAMAGAE